MDMPRLLEALLEKLDLLQSVITGYPEARLILGVASCRLAVLLSNYFADALAPPPEPIHTASSPKKNWRHSPIVLSGHKRSMAQRSILESIRCTK